MIKAVVFDMDGVLIDARDWHFEALNLALEPFGFKIPIEDHLNIYDGLPTSKKLEILSCNHGLPKKLHKVISSIKQDRTLRIAAQKCFPNMQHLILIQKLKEDGYRIGVYTNSIRQTTTFMLTHAHLYDLFDYIVTNEDVAEPKPSPEGYLKLASHFGLKSNEVLVVEDGDYGVEAAKSAGCQVLRITNPNQLNYDNVYANIGKHE